jgi:DNA-binding NarL/FixJ family response regulator
MTLALALLYDLEPRAALEHAEVAEEIARLQDARVKAGMAASVRSQVLDLLGRPAEAVAAAGESLRTLERAETTFLTTTANALSLTVIHEHDAERLLHEVLGLFGDASDGVTRPTTPLRALVAAALATGRRAEAEAWIDAYAVRAEPMRAGSVRVALARAELMLADDEPARAAETARAAVERADALEVRLDAARARVVLGRALGAAGDRAGALVELERVVADAGAAGADRLSSEATRELRRLGARPTAAAQRAASGSADELSERERAIAELVAEGRSNKEVAAALFLSGKTIENNLSRIYAKLGVRSRTELARALAGR